MGRLGVRVCQSPSEPVLPPVDQAVEVKCPALLYSLVLRGEAGSLKSYVHAHKNPNLKWKFAGRGVKTAKEAQEPT